MEETGGRKIDLHHNSKGTPSAQRPQIYRGLGRNMGPFYYINWEEGQSSANGGDYPLGVVD